MGDSDLMMVGWLDTNLEVRLLRLYRISRYPCVHLFMVIVDDGGRRGPGQSCARGSSYLAPKELGSEDEIGFGLTCGAGRWNPHHVMAVLPCCFVSFPSKRILAGRVRPLHPLHQCYHGAMFQIVYIIESS